MTIHDEYFEWLCNVVRIQIDNSPVSYRTLMLELYNTAFFYSVPRDSNREADGIDLRYRFATENRYDYHFVEGHFNGCSVLEMMVALALRCDETIMDDPVRGSRTGHWFWCMIKSLGLHNMTNRNFDAEEYQRIIINFLNRDYDYDGKGGLFYIPGSQCDMRQSEIWNQLCWWLNTIT